MDGCTAGGNGDRKMKRIAKGIFLAVSMGLLLTGCHSHQWEDATCTAPRTCVDCGETEGEALGHKWQEADCTVPISCSVCGETEGKALGHDWQEADCTTPAVCRRCGETEGEALGHDWQEADYQTPKTCSVCGEIQGKPLASEFEAAGLVCHSQENIAHEYIVGVEEDGEIKTGARLVLTNCKTFDSDENFAAKEGYEWKTARIDIIINDKNAWMYHPLIAWFYTDYYTIALCEESREELSEYVNRYTVSFHGLEYTECLASLSFGEITEWQYGAQLFSLNAAFQVPKGYDGVVIGFFDQTAGMQDEIDMSQEGIVYLRLK